MNKRTRQEKIEELKLKGGVIKIAKAYNYSKEQVSKSSREKLDKLRDNVIKARPEFQPEIEM